MSRCFPYGQPFSEWSRYAKWNLACGSPGCHEEKYFGPKRKRREALKRGWQKDWAPDLGE